MSNPNQSPQVGAHAETDFDRQVERLVDTIPTNYDHARSLVEAGEGHPDEAVAETAKAARDVSHAYYRTEFRQTGPFSNTPEEIEAHRVGVQGLRNALHQAQRER